MNMNDGEALVGMKRRGSQLCTYIYTHQSVGRSVKFMYKHYGK